MHKVKINSKEGAEKLRAKRISVFKAARSDPKQKKLQFCTTINTQNGTRSC